MTADQASDSNDTDIWTGDLLNRKADAEHLKNFVLQQYEKRLKEGRTASYILNVDASWGEGKSFFLERFAHQLRADGHLIASINAWQDDLSGEPLTSIMAGIAATLQPYASTRDAAAKMFEQATRKLGIVAREAGKQMAVHGLKVLTGISVQRIAEELGTKDADEKVGERTGNAGGDASAKIAEKAFEKDINDHQETIAALAAFKKNLADTLTTLSADHGEINPPFFVLIDELDRCRPSYAIRLLEDAKHIFEVSGVVFIIATDSLQLSHSVKAIYGTGFEARRYLRRFFDRVYVFPHTDRRSFCKALFMRAEVDEASFSSVGDMQPHELLASWMRKYGVSTRDAEQCFEIIATFTTSWDHTHCKINLFFLICLVWAFYIRDDDAMDGFSDLDARSVVGTFLKGWAMRAIVKEPFGDRSFRQYRAVKQDLDAENLMVRLMQSISRAALHEYEDAVWGPSLEAEFETRDSPQLHGRHNKSVLTEYPSRVWNSGRVIERIPPPRA